MFLGLVTSVTEFTNLFLFPFPFLYDNKKGMEDGSMPFAFYMNLFLCYILLDTKFFCDVLRKSILVNNYIHGFVFDKCLGSVPCTVVLACLTP